MIEDTKEQTDETQSDVPVESEHDLEAAQGQGPDSRDCPGDEQVQEAPESEGQAGPVVDPSEEFGHGEEEPNGNVADLYCKVLDRETNANVQLLLATGYEPPSFSVTDENGEVHEVKLWDAKFISMASRARSISKRDGTDPRQVFIDLNTERIKNGG